MTPMSNPPAAVPHESHGNTPAAWTTVTIVMVAFFLGTLAVVIANWPLFWVSVGLLVVAVIVGKIMAMAGLGFTFIPEFAVTMPGLRVRPLIEPEIVRSIQVVTVRGRPHVPAVGAFVRQILAFAWVKPGT